MKILAPLGWLFFLGTKIRWLLTCEKSVSVPVLCVGNITVGGTGKTPLVLALLDHLKKQGYQPHILSRGYGGRLSNIQVNIKNHGAKEVGDEPRMMAEYAPVWIGKNRHITAEMAIQKGADILIMDDGFQNRTLKKDFSILVFDGAKGIGNGMGLPVGPLREPLSSGLKRADAVIMVGQDQTNLTPIFQKKPIYFANFKPLKLPDLKKKYLAFAGIGRPQKFFDMLKLLSFKIIQTAAFPDHHVYDKSDRERLQKQAKKLEATLITTEKDAIKLPQSFRKKTTVLKVKMVFQNQKFFEQIDHFLKAL